MMRSAFAAAAITLALGAVAQAQPAYNYNQTPSASPQRYVPPGAYPDIGTRPMPRQPLAAMPAPMPEPAPMATPAHPFAGLTLPPSRGDVNKAYDGGGVVLEYRPDGSRSVIR